MSYFYHYTDEEGCEKIIRSGKVMASIAVSGDTAYGNGVYLTKLSPEKSSKSEIAMNNWLSTDAKVMSKTKNYFVFNIPEFDAGCGWRLVRNVVDTKAKGRNIFLFGQRNDLRLEKYPWWLKDFDSGNIIASYKYQVASLGPASEIYGSLMGDYVMTENWVNGRPVYKRVKFFFKYYLFMSSTGKWLISSDFGEDSAWLVQRSTPLDSSEGGVPPLKQTNSLGPALNLPWEYMNRKGEWSKDDAALKAYAWQK